MNILSFANIRIAEKVKKYTGLCHRRYSPAPVKVASSLFHKDMCHLRGGSLAGIITKSLRLNCLKRGFLMVNFTSIEEFIHEIERTDDLQNLQDRFTEILKPLGFDKHTCLSFVDMNDPPANAVLLFSFPEAWVDHYKQEKYFEDDIVLKSLFRETKPCIWHELRDLDKRNQQIFSEAGEFGISNGITIPIILPGYYPCTVNIAGDHKDTDPKIFHALHLMAIHYHSRVLKINGQIPPQINQIHLTSRERDCLNWIAYGKTSWEISMILGVSENAINFHIKNIFVKLDVCTRAMAIFKASQLGLLYACSTSNSMLVN